MPFVKVADRSGTVRATFLLEKDNDTLPLSEVVNHFTGAIGLKYVVGDDQVIVRLRDGVFHPPATGWGTKVFSCYYGTAQKRKAEDAVEGSVKAPKVDAVGEELTSKYDAERKLMYKLYSLGLPWRTYALMQDKAFPEQILDFRPPTNTQSSSNKNGDKNVNESLNDGSDSYNGISELLSESS